MFSFLHKHHHSIQRCSLVFLSIFEIERNSGSSFIELYIVFHHRPTTHFVYPHIGGYLGCFFLGGGVSFVFFCFGYNQQTLLFFTCLQFLVLSSPEFMTSSSSSILDCLNNREDMGTSRMALSSHHVVGMRTSPKDRTSLLVHLGPSSPVTHLLPIHSTPFPKRQG